MEEEGDFEAAIDSRVGSPGHTAKLSEGYHDTLCIKLASPYPDRNRMHFNRRAVRELRDALTEYLGADEPETYQGRVFEGRDFLGTCHWFEVQRGRFAKARVTRLADKAVTWASVLRFARVQNSGTYAHSALLRHVVNDVTDQFPCGPTYSVEEN
ncbi:hypothetical protein [Herbihabitans rhizosphaerae]|uniref:hypothetical protein n=1 Tax=Herbihabitans rhizosphaerae TaxID=1872711 RepID=UPI00102B058D|nr:hypothetical protein [Herbihabitans rhizosphaerae]